ncbi:MAG TPA: M67 family metallopeptidase [Methylomirabilota bacterium]|nr:M67 family metallopeptidase [Methylomirabilota bacterium]
MIPPPHLPDGTRQDMIHLDENLATGIRAHAAREYPYECCGALLGADGATGREVRALLPLANGRDDSPRNRFLISADEVCAAERAAAERGLGLIGWYHSHPDHPARPSEFDREHAWPWYSYIIVRVAGGAAEEMTSWRLRDDRTHYDPEEIQPAPAGSPAMGGKPTVPA